ncbi:MAG: bifunctional 3,4-dihydroxy-2-butanone-4-phosphate synthase/GTP cyclohydrolase II [Acidimicrobiia bacterium]
MIERVDRAVKAFRNGEFVVVTDDESRENEGDLILAAQMVTADKIAFMVRYTSGLICLPTTGERLDELDIPMMVVDNTDAFQTAFTISVDVVKDTTTGISAADRARTIAAFVDPATKPSDLRRPGHIFPLRYHDGGVIARPGHTEASIDLARMAGLYPAGVLCEIVNDDGTMMRGDDLDAFAQDQGLEQISISDLVAYRWRTEQLVSRVSEAILPTPHGDFRVVGYRSDIDGSAHVALVRGDVAEGDDVLSRIHSVCLTGDVFGSLRCDCGAQLDESMRLIAEADRGVIVYNTSHEGRGIGILDKIAAYHLQEEGLDTVDANRQIGHSDDRRHYGVDAQILHDLGLRSVRLLTNNPDKITQLQRYGITITDRQALWVGETPENETYLRTKERRMGHIAEEVTE